jgi:hypothetical protein
MRRVFLSISVLLIVLVAGAVAIVAYDRQPNGPRYSVAQLRVALAKNPASWLGKTVQVRGMAGGMDRTDSAQGPMIALWDAGNSNGPQPPLLLHPELGRGLIPVIRHLPVLGSLVSAPQTIRETVATYRIRLQAFRHGRCRDDVFSCYYGILLDADAAL